MDTSELIRLHRRDQRRRGVLPSSILKSAQLLTRFGAAVDPDGLLDAGTETVEAFLDTLSLTARSRYTYISTLHAFYAWAIHAGHTDTDPTADIIRPRFAPGMPRPIPDADLAQALAMADPETAVILASAAFAGMRCIEIARLARHDIRDAEGLLCVHGKGGKRRTVPIHPSSPPSCPGTDCRVPGRCYAAAMAGRCPPGWCRRRPTTSCTASASRPPPTSCATGSGPGCTRRHTTTCSSSATSWATPR